MNARSAKSSRGPFEAVLRDLGVSADVVRFATEIRTARQAADAVGCALGQIVKSLVFRGLTSETAVLVLTSGANRVDEGKLSAHAREAITKADAEYVRTKTGYAIGGVPPFGHVETLATFIDQDLMDFDVVWAAAGSPKAVFPLSTKLLCSLTGGEVIEVCER